MKLSEYSDQQEIKNLVIKSFFGQEEEIVESVSSSPQIEEEIVSASVEEIKEEIEEEKFIVNRKLSEFQKGMIAGALLLFLILTIIRSLDERIVIIIKNGDKK